MDARLEKTDDRAVPQAAPAGASGDVETGTLGHEDPVVAADDTDVVSGYGLDPAKVPDFGIVGGARMQRDNPLRPA